jgi:hypothetical protein
MCKETASRSVESYNFDSFSKELESTSSPTFFEFWADWFENCNHLYGMEWYSAVIVTLKGISSHILFSLL